MELIWVEDVRMFTSNKNKELEKWDKNWSAKDVSIVKVRLSS